MTLNWGGRTNRASLQLTYKITPQSFGRTGRAAYLADARAVRPYNKQQNNTSIIRTLEPSVPTINIQNNTSTFRTLEPSGLFGGHSSRVSLQ